MEDECEGGCIPCFLESLNGTKTEILHPEFMAMINNTLSVYKEHIPGCPRRECDDLQTTWLASELKPGPEDYFINKMTRKKKKGLIHFIRNLFKKNRGRKNRGWRDSGIIRYG